MISTRIISISCSICLLAASAFAQDVDAKIDKFNEAIGKEYSVEHKGKMLLVNGFREGKQVKVDKVNVYDLDLATIKYSEADNTVSVNCFDDLDGCVEQQLLLDKRKSYRKRLVFGISDGVSADEIVSDLQLLLTDMTKKY